MISRFSSLFSSSLRCRKLAVKRKTLLQARCRHSFLLGRFYHSGGLLVPLEVSEAVGTLGAIGAISPGAFGAIGTREPLVMSFP